MPTVVKLIIALAVPVLVGWSASWFTIPEIQGWYSTLNKPSWNPPNWLFGPVWTLLYVLMGIVLFLTWKAHPEQKKIFVLFFAQLTINFLWSLLFFNAHRIGLAMVDLLVLWILLWMLIIAVGKVDLLASWLLVPYIGWVSFAGVLNFMIWQLNKA